MLFMLCLINCLKQRNPELEANMIDGQSRSGNQLQAIVAAMLGLLHIDQMPANVPWLTNANSQRILGRLSPGRPASWRQLVRCMADFHPPAMKLKDAV